MTRYWNFFSSVAVSSFGKLRQAFGNFSTTKIGKMLTHFPDFRNKDESLRKFTHQLLRSIRACVSDFLGGYIAQREFLSHIGTSGKRALLVTISIVCKFCILSKAFLSTPSFIKNFDLNYSKISSTPEFGTNVAPFFTGGNASQGFGWISIPELTYGL